MRLKSVRPSIEEALFNLSIGSHEKMVTMLRASFTLEPSHRLHLGQTFAPLQRGTFDPLFRSVKDVRGQTYWATAREGSTGLLVRFRREAGGSLEAPVAVTLWSETTGAQAAADLESFARRVPAWLGEDDQWSAFYGSDTWELLPQRLQITRARNPGLRLPAIGLLSQNLIQAITEQRVTGIEAMGGMRALLRQYGQPVPATGEPDQPAGMLIFPEASVFTSIPSWTWHRAGYDRARSDAIVQYARTADPFERLASAGDVAPLARALASLPGVGPWTISETLQRFCGHPDAVSVGDYHLAHHVTYAFDGRRGDDARMVELLAPYRGHRQRVVSLIKAAGISEPRRAARLAPEDHRSF